MMPSDVLSEEAEESTARLYRAMAGYQITARRERSSSTSRLRQHRADEDAQERRQATLIRLLSIAEAFAAELLWREVESEVGAIKSSLATKFMIDAIIGGTATWEAQRKAYDQWLAVKPHWTTINQLAEARNAAAHGLGKLTRRQTRTEREEASTKGKLDNVNVKVVDRRILLSEQNLTDTLQACCNFIAELDQLVRRRRSSSGSV